MHPNPLKAMSPLLRRLAIVSAACVSSVWAAAPGSGGTGIRPVDDRPAAEAAAPGAPRALPAGQLPEDRRLGELRTLNDEFPFREVASVEAWAHRAAALRRRARVATGLWPWPSRTPLNTVVHGRVEQSDYAVEKVYFESMPGHFVTGNLYRPIGPSARLGVKDGGRPGVLCPHGHWDDGRFFDAGREEVRRQIAAGAERFEVGGRSPLQARCVQLARMGCIVFHYDMIGYADSVQIEHRPGVRPHMNTADGWGFFSPQAELRLQNMMGVQTWNSVRALDFLLSLEEVDAERIAVTGASGGGTQTFMLAAVDDRPDVLFPAVMVSTAMQGGCTCENAPYLRIGAGNVDLAALAAPRPLGLTAADDWTKEIETKGLPDLRKLYEMLGRADHVHGEAFLHFGHNYNSVSRTVMYGWLNRRLGLGLETPVLERDYPRLTGEGLSVWDAQHPRPGGEQAGETHERALLKWWWEDIQQKLDALAPTDPGATGLAEYRRVVGGGWEVILGRSIADVGAVDWELAEKVDRGDCLLMTGLLTHAAEGEQLPALFLHPSENWNGQVVIWVTEVGKAGLLSEDGAPIGPVGRLLEAGFSVAGVDLFGQGEFVEGGPGAPGLQKQRLWHQGDGSQPWHRYAGYTFGYNHPLFVKRVHDILTLVRFVRDNERHPPRRVHLVGLGRTAGPLAAAARWRAGDAVDRAAIDTGGFRFADVTAFEEPMFVPGAVRYHDVPGLLALGAPGALWLAGEDEEGLRLIRAAYRATGAEAALQRGETAEAADAAAAWLME